MTKNKWKWLLGCALLTVGAVPIGCSSCNETASKEGKAVEAKAAASSKALETPDGTVRAVVDSLRSGENLATVWRALPASYQKDVNDLVRVFAAQMDKEVWNKAWDVLGKLLSAAEKQQEFVFHNEGIQAMIAQGMGGDDRTDTKAQLAKAEAAYGGVLEMLKFLVRTPVSKLENLKKFDGAAFVDDVQKLSASLDAEAKKKIKRLQDAYVAANEKKSKEGVRVEKVTADDKSAVLKMTWADGKTQLMEMVKVEGRWIPKDMADAWKKGVQQAKQEMMEWNADPQEKVQLMGFLAMVESAVDQLDAAQTQAEFDQVLAALMASL